MDTSRRNLFFSLCHQTNRKKKIKLSNPSLSPLKNKGKKREYNNSRLKKKSEDKNTTSNSEKSTFIALQVKRGSVYNAHRTRSYKATNLSVGSQGRSPSLPFKTSLKENIHAANMDVDNKTSAGKLFWIRQVWISPLEMQYDARLPKMATRYSIWKEPHMEKRHYEKKKKKGNGGKKREDTNINQIKNELYQRKLNTHWPPPPPHAIY